MSRLTRLHRDERGMSFVFVGMGFMAFLAATTLAIDIGMFMTARSQAQNSADAGALAGAVALAFDNYDNRSASGPAVQSALQAALGNEVMGEDVSVFPSDVTFPVGPDGVSNRVKVDVYRTAAEDRNNPVPTLMGQYFGVTQVDIVATATAIASPADAMTCVKPFTIPDKWIEMQTPPWDESDTFDMYEPGNGNKLLPNPDIYIPSNQANTTGYHKINDRGRYLMIRAGNHASIQPSFYFSYSMGGVTGSNEYGWNIENCNTTIMRFGDRLLMEPGAMVGDTTKAIDALIARDPNAWYNTSTRTVVTTMNPSPRVAILPVYDPVYYETGKQNGRTADLKVANYIGFFIHRRVGSNIYGYITPVNGLYTGNGPAPAGAFPMSVRLVE